MTLTIDIKDSATDKILYFLEHCKDDVEIISTNPNSHAADELSKHAEKIEQALQDAKEGKGRIRSKIGEL